jgi:hypothetical protein
MPFTIIRELHVLQKQNGWQDNNKKKYIALHKDVQMCQCILLEKLTA